MTQKDLEFVMAANANAAKARWYAARDAALVAKDAADLAAAERDAAKARWDAARDAERDAVRDAIRDTARDAVEIVPPTPRKDLIWAYTAGWNDGDRSVVQDAEAFVSRHFPGAV